MEHNKEIKYKLQNLKGEEKNKWVKFLASRDKFVEKKLQNNFKTRNIKDRTQPTCWKGSPMKTLRK